MTRHDRERRRMAPVGYGDARGAGRSDGRGHTGNDLVRHARRAQRLALLRAPPEHERVSTLQSDDDTAAPGRLDQQGVDLLLWQRMALTPGPLPHEDPLGPGRRLFEQVRMHQPIVHHDLGRPQALHAAPRDQSRIPRACTDDIDDPLAPGRRFLRGLHQPADAATGARHVAAPHQRDHVGIDDAIPQPGADASVGDPPRQLGPQLAQQLEQRRVFRSDQPPDPLAQPHRERGALPCGRNGDRHVALAVDRGGDEAAVR